MMDSFSTLQIGQATDGTVSLRLDRPERYNAIGTTMAAELTEFAGGFGPRFGRDSSSPCRALVLSATPKAGRSQRIAIAGGDLKELYDLHSPEDAARYSGQLQGFCKFLEELPVPVVGRVDGGLIGGGAELFLACDVIYGTAASFFWFKQLEVGLPTGYGGGLRLSERVGVARASQWLLDPEKISCQMAAEAGLVQRMFLDGEALDAHIAERLAFWTSRPATLLAAQKAMLTAARHPDRDQLLAAEQELFVSQWRNPTHSAQLEGFNRS